MNGILKISRRDFMKRSALAGGGLILGMSLSRGSRFSHAAEPAAAVFRPNAFLRIGTDDGITIIVNHSEMGQGVYTSLPMLVAEELEAEWSTIRIEAAPVDPAYNHAAFGAQMTGGSSSVWSEYDRLRSAGAAAREMLIAAAADRWKAEKRLCRAERGRVLHRDGRSLTYGQLAERAARMPVPKNVRLKPPRKFTLIGKPLPRLDAREKSDGTAVFGIDVTLPGMLTAVVAHPPVFGAAVARVDDGKARSIPGVRDVVRVPSGVAVIATGFRAARLGRDALEIVWNEGPNAALSTETLRGQYRKLAETAGAVARKVGNVETGFTQAARTLTAEYEVPYLAHAAMEPLNCTVDLRPDRCEIWTGTQFQTGDHRAAAAAAGMKPEQVTLHTTYLGGGFGRRANPHSDFVVEAVHVARMVKAPVQVIWTRENDMRGGYYRPLWYDRIVGGIDSKGSPVAWKHTIVGQSIIVGTPFAEGMIRNGIDETSVEGAADLPYAIPHLLVDLHTPAIGVPVLWWRSVGHSHTAFVVESFLDELARAAGADPFAYRNKLLAKFPRHRGVLRAVAKMSGWGKKPPEGRARGIAVHGSFGSYVAQVAEVSLGARGEVRVHKVFCAVDCGRFVNPDIIHAQMESAVSFGLSAVLHGEITLQNGRVEQSNFHDYQVLRFPEMPDVETFIVPSMEKPGGIGEPGVPPLAPAVCNAIFALTGRRIRRLPIRADDLKNA